MTRHLSDAELVRASRERPELFAALFDRHHDRIHAYLARRLGAAADDVASETFLVAFRRRGAYDPARGDAAPWLFGIAVRLAAAHRRSERRALRRPAPERPEPDAALAAVDARPSRRESAALRGALADLRPGERDALTLHVLAGLSYDEVAAALGVRPGTVASRIARARARLAARLEPLRGLPPVSPPDRTEVADGPR